MARNGSTMLLIAFRLADQLYALPVQQVVEVLRMASLTSLPDAPAWLPGMLNLRGDIVPVIDLRQRLGKPASEPGLNTPIIVGEDGGMRVGLIGDALIGTLEVPSTALKIQPAWAAARHPVRAVGRAGEEVVFILDLPCLMVAEQPADPWATPPAPNGARARAS